jgi:hypothetical protein
MKHCCGKEDPKWNFNTPCLQDHEHTEVYYNYTTTVKTVTPFNVPKVENKVEVRLDNVKSILPGSILWNQKIGGMSVVSFDAATQTAIVTPANINVDFGSLVPMGTEFMVGIPAIDINDTKEYLDSPYLAADFISPAVGECQNASVTSVSGLTINDKVSIAGYVYKVGAIINKSTLRLCNDGEGAEGGVVIAFDPEDCGEPSVPIIVYETSPCEATPVQTGNIVVCNSGSLTTLTGEADGQMVRWNNNHKRWELVNAYIDENCSYLTTCFTVDTLDQSYVATVKSTTVFSLDNKVIIDDTKFTVEEIVDSTHLKLKPETRFTEIVTYPTGTNICIENCCAWVPKKLADTVDSDSWRPISLANYITTFTGETSVPSATLNNTTLSAGQSITNDTITFSSVQNSNKQYPMLLHIRSYSYVNGIINESANKILLTRQKNVINILYKELDSNNNEISKTETYEQTGFDTIYIDSVSVDGNRPKSFFICQERVFELPAYNESHPDVSKCSINITHEFTVLNNSNTTFTFSAGHSNRRLVETRVYIEADYNGALQ